MISKPGLGFLKHPGSFVRVWLLIVVRSVFLLSVSGCTNCPLCGGEWPADQDRRVIEPVGPVEMRTIVGKVSCLERVTVLPTFEIRVQLVTLGSSTCENQVIAECLIPRFQEFPVPFELMYVHDDIETSRSYGLVAELLSQGASLFTTDTQYKVLFEASAPPYDLVLVRKK